MKYCNNELFLIFLIPLFPYNSKVESNCPGLIIDSNCGGIQSSEWNTKNIGLNLKEWIKSVKIVLSLNDPDKIHSTIRYRASINSNDTMLLHLSSLDCKTKQNIGPMWQIAGKRNEIGDNGFNDGFFYVIPSKPGKKYLILISHKLISYFFGNVIAI